MTARSVRRRTSRRRAPARSISFRSVPSRSAGVVVQLVDFATGITQSFLIMNGDTMKVQLTGYIGGSGIPRVTIVPLTIRAHIA